MRRTDAQRRNGVTNEGAMECRCVASPMRRFNGRRERSERRERRIDTSSGRRGFAPRLRHFAEVLRQN
jgi:hypothetical protein